MPLAPRRGARVAALLVSVLVVALIAARAQARPDGSLAVHLLKVPGHVLDVAYGDVDGDGKEDIIVSHQLGENRDETGALMRYISVFRQGEGGERWSAAPSLTRNVPADAVAFSVGDFDANKGDDVALFGSRFVNLMVKGPDGSLLSHVAPVCTIDGFFEYPQNGALPRWDLARDLGSGRKTLLVPVKEGYALFKNDAKTGLARAGTVKVSSSERFGPAFETKFLNRFLTYFTSMPRLCAIDLDGDRRTDLVVYRKRGLARFFQHGDGGFSETPDDEKPLSIVEEAAKRGKKKGLDGKESDSFANVRLTIKDLDGDGYPELIATKTVGEIGVFETLRTQVIVWRGSKAGWNESKPDRVIGQKGVTTDPELIDWDGDGKLDIVCSSLRMDYFTNVKRAITKSITITYAIYLQKDSFFSDEPDFTKDVSLDLDAIERRNGAENVSFEADLNGDKLHDMLVRSERGKLRIVPGKWDSGFFSGKTLAFDEDNAFEVAVPPNCDIDVHDLYRDGKGDALVISSPGPDDAEKSLIRVIEVRR